MHACIGKENSNPLQCSYLENPRDGGAWWAAIYGVAQSQTQLKRLSSSSMDLTFQVPIQYCSLQLQTLLSPPDPATTGHCFHLGSGSFLLELFLWSSPVAYWAPTDTGSSSFSILSFCLLILFMRFSRQNTEVLCHSLLQWSTFCQNSPP